MWCLRGTYTGTGTVTGTGAITVTVIITIINAGGITSIAIAVVVTIAYLIKSTKS